MPREHLLWSIPLENLGEEDRKTVLDEMDKIGRSLSKLSTIAPVPELKTTIRYLPEGKSSLEACLVHPSPRAPRHGGGRPQPVKLRKNGEEKTYPSYNAAIRGEKLSNYPVNAATAIKMLKKAGWDVELL